MGNGLILIQICFSDDLPCEMIVCDINECVSMTIELQCNVVWYFSVDTLMKFVILGALKWVDLS